MHDDDDAGVWPAYVAAVAGLLLSLLLLTAIMALVMFILGLVVGHNMDADTGATASEAAAPKSGTAHSPPPLPPFTTIKPAMPAVPLRSVVPERTTPPGVRPPVPGSGHSAERARITFAQDTVHLNRAQSEQLKVAIARLVNAGQHNWQLTLATQTDNPEKARAGYLRLLAIRNVMIAAGVDPLSIGMHLVNAPAGAADRDEQSVVVSSGNETPTAGSGGK